MYQSAVTAARANTSLSCSQLMQHVCAVHDSEGGVSGFECVKAKRMPCVYGATSSHNGHAVSNSA